MRADWQITPLSQHVGSRFMSGDIVLWDNFSTVHSASPLAYSNTPGERRLLHRISTKGVPDCCAAG